MDKKDRCILVNAIGTFDRKQSTKKGYNRFALPIMLQAVNNVEEDIKNGDELRRAIVSNFSGRLCAAILKALNLGEYTKEDAKGF